MIRSKAVLILILTTCLLFVACNGSKHSSVRGTVNGKYFSRKKSIYFSRNAANYFSEFAAFYFPEFMLLYIKPAGV